VTDGTPASVPFVEDGRIALTLDGVQARFVQTGNTQGVISGNISPSDPLTIEIKSTDYTLQMGAYFPQSASIIATQPLNYLSLARGFLADTGDSASSYGLGPSGGTITITEAVPLGVYERFRLRATFSAEICPDRSEEANFPCRRIEGSIAFNEHSPPAGRTLDNL
jgi:hypothetical protein